MYFVLLLLSNDDLLRLPVPLISPQKSHYVIQAAAVKRIAKFSKCFLQVLIGGLISAKKVLMVAKEKEDKYAKEGSEGHDHYG